MRDQSTATLIVLITYNIRSVPHIEIATIKQSGFRLTAIVDLNLKNQFCGYASLFDCVYYVPFFYSDSLFVGNVSAEACNAIDAERKLNPCLRLVSFSEGDIELTAQLRSQFNIPGMNTQQTLLFRNKLQFKHQLLKHHVLVPKGFLIDFGLSERRLFDQCVEHLSLPFIVKPVDRAGSLGVCKITSFNQFTSFYADHLEGDYLAEEWIDGRLFHWDALVHQGIIKWFGCSEYNLPLGEFANGYPIGSMPLLASDTLYQQFYKKFTEIIQIFPDYSGVIHLEAFVTACNRIYILEAAARPGGSLIVSIYKNMIGYNLIQAFLAQELSIDYTGNITSGLAYFWLCFPHTYNTLEKLAKADLKATYDLTFSHNHACHPSGCMVGQFNQLSAYSDSYHQLKQEFLLFHTK